MDAEKMRRLEEIEQFGCSEVDERWLCDELRIAWKREKEWAEWAATLRGLLARKGKSRWNEFVEELETRRNDKATKIDLDFIEQES